MTRVGKVRRRVCVGVLTTLLLTPSSIPRAAIAQTNGCTGSNPTVTWDGGAGTNRWEDGANWNPDGEPFTNNGVPDDYICIPGTLNGNPVHVLLGAGVESHLIGIDGEGTLTVGEGGKLFLHGPEPSTMVDFNLEAGTLGGEGTVTISRSFNWIGLPRFAATQTTQKLEDLPPNGSLTNTPGKTVIGEDATLNVIGELGHPYDPDAPDGDFGCDQGLCGGVNLFDRRIIENRGVTTLQEGGYIAADWGTTFRNIGTFYVENDRGYFEGFSNAGELRSKFINSGLLQKTSTSDEDGPTTVSVFDALYSEPTESSAQIVIESGSISILTPLGQRRSAIVSGGASFETGACEGEDQTCVVPEPDSADRQTSRVALPVNAAASFAEIFERAQTTHPRRYKAIGERVSYSVPEASPTIQDPLRVSVTIDSTQGSQPERVYLFVGSSRIPKCGSKGLTATRRFCVDQRTLTDAKDVRVEISTTDSKATVRPFKLRDH